MSIHKTLALGVLAAAVIPAGAFAARIDQVFVANKGTAEAVPSEIVNQPTITLAGTPKVGIDPAANTVTLAADSLPGAPAPFQKLFDLDVPSDTELCNTVEAPTGAVVSVQHVVASVLAPSAQGIGVELNYLPGGNTGQREIRQLMSGEGPPSATIDLLVHLGLGEPKLRLQACVTNALSINRRVAVLVSGTQQPS